MSWLAVGLGAAIGAWLRWGLGMLMNQVHQHIPLGTLVANLAGGYVIGLAMAFFSTHNGISPEWRLFAITGFLGGLTTFSTFSAETALMLQRGEYVWAALQIVLHVAGAILLCMAGFASYRCLSGL
ncbi:fluoride efflux transporter CrcB [Oxalobacter aliiformigenes]|uniref:Fluoride-specific ion channel FluC n=1 Tax=Oxalobacter aliiformigenes TaxID=2946593 RepID=A0ABY7JG00_9BURK|nr:fluoride efflux transporter CrcB [Oxalobacter aliiformigenes]WAV88782.1 fluoride efflux transporter CrcB [Oxalobacter aliiformigenes]WAV92851.1 fluoride efflux transporter CrcB [Oxalobacter aliiformigenes]WAV95644.1 fluoride efflux transporter CrcB [Oxalobacter aliiformigenes]WAV96561.1 fluoride efflux transporter CrcB [Oxalobacter aliiformigenes]